MALYSFVAEEKGRPPIAVERGRDVPRVRGVSLRLLRLGGPRALRPRAVRRPAGRGDRGRLRDLGRDLRVAQGARLAEPPGVRRRPQAGGADHGRQGLRRPDGPVQGADHDRRQGGQAVGGPGRPGLQPERSGRDLVWRYHLHPHRRGLAVPRYRHRPVQPPRRRLGPGRPHACELVCDALAMAIATRGGHVDGVVFHSDRGCQPGFKESSQHCLSGRA